MSSLMDAFARIESGGNPLAWNRRPGGGMSRYRGLFQFGPDLERRYGITDWQDVGQQQRAFGQHMDFLRSGLTRRLGRAPSDGELYLAHQQGIAGAPSLLTAAPGTAAWRAIRQFYGSDALAQQAIMGNIPRGHRLAGMPIDSISAQDFARLWTDRFPGGGQPGGGGPPTTAPLGAPVAPPVASTAGVPSPLTGGPPSDTGQSWLQRIGAGLTGALGAINPIGSAQAETPPMGGGPADGTQQRPFSREEIQSLGPSGVRPGMFYRSATGGLMVVQQRPDGSWYGQPAPVTAPPSSQPGPRFGSDAARDALLTPFSRGIQGGPPVAGLLPQAAPPPTTPPVTPPTSPIPDAELQRLLQGGGGQQPETLAGLPPPPPVAPPEPPPPTVGPAPGTMLSPDSTLPPGLRRFMPSSTGDFVPAPPVPTVPPFGAPTVTPAPESGSFGHPMGQSELQPMGQDLVRESGLTPPPAPTPDADAIVRGAQSAADERTATQQAQPGYFERLMSNPAFLAGLSILGTAPGGNWGPAGAQAATQAIRAGREGEEWRRLQARRTTMDRIWREAFGANGSPNATHPLLQGVPPEMAQTIYAMGAEEGLPALQRWQMFRGQQSEQLRIQQLQEEARMRMYGMGGQPPPGGDGLAVATGDRLRAGAGLPGITDTSGIVPPTPPPTGGPPSTSPGGPPSGPPGGEPVIRIGNVSMPLSVARARALATPHAGERTVLEQAIAAAERDVQTPQATRQRAIQTNSAYGTISGALTDYVRLVEQAGMTGASWPGAMRDAIVRARTDILLQLKEAYNLGVLNGPDYELMSSMLFDPTISFGNIVGHGSVADRARAGADHIRRILQRTRDNAFTAAGMQVPDAGTGSSQPPPEGGFSIRRIN
jgi:hypothetical protein